MAIKKILRSAPSTNTTIEPLLALYRREQEHWSPNEMLDGLLELPNMPAGTVASIAARLDRPRCTRTVVATLGELAIREMVNRDHAGDVAAFVRRQAEARAECEMRRAGAA